MGVIDEALQFGHNAEEILDTLSRSNTKFRNLISKAISFGYPAEEILQRISTYFRGEKGGKFAKKLGYSPSQVKNLVFEESEDLATGISKSLRPSQREQGLISGLGKVGLTAIGAAAGYGLAGPSGAATGAEIGQGLAPTEPTPPPAPTQPQPEAIQPTPQPEAAKQSYIQRALEGVNIASIPAQTRNRVSTLSRKLEEYEQKKIPYDDPKVQKIVGKIYEVLEGKKPTIAEKETERFEKEYGQQPEETIPDETINEVPKAREKLRESLKKKKGILENYLGNIGSISVDTEKARPISAQEIEAFKSSNVRYADYDPKTQVLDALFSPEKETGKGKIYRYKGVPAKDVEQFLSGADTVSTTGENRLRAWYKGKQKSLGAAFDKYIKQKDENGNYLFEPTIIDASQVRDKDLLKVRDADKVSVVSQYANSFEELFKTGKKKETAKSLRETMEALRNLDVEHLVELLDQVEKEMKATGKKRFKGGKEEEIKRRLLGKV